MASGQGGDGLQAPRATALAILALLVTGSLLVPVGQTHFLPSPNEKLGHTESLFDPLLAYEFHGPPGTPIENRPCMPALNYLGPHDSAIIGNWHIGHVTAAQGLNPVVPNNFLRDGSVDTFHFEFYENPRLFEGPPGDEDKSVMMGVDGFVNGQFTVPVEDGLGYDLEVHDFHDWSSYCAYGGLSKDGPWFFMSTAFRDSTLGASPIDLEDYYAELYHTFVGPGVPRVDWILLVASLEKYPLVRADFGIFDGVTLVPPGGAVVPGTTVRFADAYPAISTPTDPASVRHGFPKRQGPVLPGPCAASGTTLGAPPSARLADDICREGLVTPDDMMNSNPDPIELWEWWFDGDPTGASSIDMTAAPAYTSSPTNVAPPPAVYAMVGEYQTCLRVSTREWVSGSPTEPVETYRAQVCKSFVVSEEPPEANIVADPRACPAADVVFIGDAFEPGDGTIVSWRWSFGDGGYGDGETVRHAYAKAGNYTVTLQVTDDDGQTTTVEGIVMVYGKEDCPTERSRSLDERHIDLIPVTGVDRDIGLRDTDGDGIPDLSDPCPTDPRPSLDSDSDGMGDGCDEDIDSDRIPNPWDVCPSTADPLQEDMDNDHVGDLCDTDMDGDALPNKGDQCPGVYDPVQEDLDGDGVGNACDTDRDGDKHLNMMDAYPDDPSRWADFDQDGVDDAQPRTREQVSAFTSGASTPRLHSPVSMATLLWVGLGGALLGVVAVCAIVLPRRKDN